MNKYNIASSPSHLIIVANPNKDSLVVHAAEKAQRALQKANISNEFVHLDALGYEPLLSREEILRRTSFDPTTNTLQKLLAKSKVLALFFPDWWGFPPATMVGCLQRIFAPDIAFLYEGKEFMPKEEKPLLSGLRVVFAICSNEKDHSAIEAIGLSFGNRLSEHAGIAHIAYSILADSKQASTHNKNLWISNTIALLK